MRQVTNKKHKTRPVKNIASRELGVWAWDLEGGQAGLLELMTMGQSPEEVEIASAKVLRWEVPCVL